MYRSVLLLSACALLSSCNGKDPEPEPSPLLDVEASATWQLSGLHGAGHIVYTEFGVPHIYAVDRHDLAMLWGYQAARDRYFMMDLSRRLALGEVSELLGRDALSSDMGSRAEGNRHIAERMLAQIEENDPDLVEIVDAYAAGVNAYIAAVEVGRLPPPSELVVAKALLGAQSEVELMKPFDRLSVVAGISTVIAQSAFEGGDVNRGFSERRLDTLYAGFDHPELRQSGMRPDLWDRPEPVFAVASAPDWDFDEDHTGRRRSLQGTATAPVETQVVKRLLAQRARWDRLRGHDWEHGWGSNAWAVSGDATTDGRSLLASDGHLSLTIPSLFYQVGLDTQHLGSDDLSFIGMVVPGLPVPGPGTNGHVAWSQIAFFGDVTDWYREEIGLDSNGLPATSVFKGQDKPLLANEEVYQIADVPLLDSVGGTDKWTRWTTFDGRWITSIEGTVVEAGTEPPSGKSVVAVGERFVIPEDLDHDGVITALSFDYAPLDGSTALRAMWDFADSKNVDDYREASRGLVGNSAGLIVADTEGSIYYTGYQAVPCREHLPRNVDGHFIEGADPTLLIDGTIYGGFTIPFKDGVVDESQTDPDKCLVPFAEYPNSKNPAQNYLVAANNDPAGYTFDGDIFNEPTYIGGPWIEGYRADTIARELKAVADDASADLDGMQRLQGNHDSRLGEQFLPYLIDALERGRELQESEPDNLAEIRMRAWYGINKERFDAVQTRLTSWGQGGFQARSGVETFYDPVLDGDLEDSVATMIFNTWYGRFLGMVLRDEGIPSGTFRPTGDSGAQRTITRMLEGRGDDNPLDMASWNPDTGESIYFDVNGTFALESSDELMLAALAEALDFLESDPTSPGVGGFGTDDMDAWLWGARHTVLFESILAEFLGDQPELSSLTEDFSISPRRFPVDVGMTPNDPRKKLQGFPRHGDHLNVDAGNSGTSGSHFNYGSGPVFRMVVALGPDGVEGRNILPGGQSGLTESQHFDDQAKVWLANESSPMRYTVQEVIAGATHREAFEPAE